MTRTDGLPPDPEVVAGLEAIEAGLADRPVDGSRRELAELARALAADRPRMDPAFAARLDARLSGKPAPRPAKRWRRRWWLWSPAAGLAACLLAAVVIVTQQGHSGPSQPERTVAQSAPTVTGGAAQAPAAASAGQAPAAASAGQAPASAAGHSPGLLQPPPNGRKITQSAQLALTAPSDRIDAVAQEVYDVIGQARGVVNNSTVTAGGPTGGYAQFQLSVPSASLPQTMASLSGLRYAQVASRTDNSQDVNDQYQSDVRRLADARALRTSLLRQLAKATTQSDIDSLTARIHDAEASISSDQAALARLNRQINFSQITLSINSGSAPSPADAGGGFTLGKAAHTAGRVLTVAAGVMLIAAAVLVPVSALALLAWWAISSVRRRRREQALDLA
jgi:Domain of unknown function (DUF4349)